MSCTSLLPPPSSLPPSRPYTGDVLSCLLLPVCLSPFLPGEDQNQREKKRGIYSLEKTSVLVQYFPRTGWRAVNLFEALATGERLSKERKHVPLETEEEKEGVYGGNGVGQIDSLLFSYPFPPQPERECKSRLLTINSGLSLWLGRWEERPRPSTTPIHSGSNECSS